MQNRLTAILSELKTHAPFTLFGAATGVLCMLLFKGVAPEVNHRLFQVFHPGHVVLSAIVTASLFKLYEKKANLLAVLVVGYVGSIGVATLSDCVVPFFGETLLGVAVPVHQDLHSDEEGHGHEEAETPAAEDASALDTHEPSERSFWSGIHLGFIEDWYVVNPAALLGIFIAWFRPHTRFPHAGHVLVSTWASSFHVLMNTHRELTPTMFIGVFLVLFVAVWLPCCISDIVFPLLFVKSGPLCIHGHPAPETQS